MVGLAHAVVVSGSVIIGNNGLPTLGQAHERHKSQLRNTADNSHGAYRHVTAVKLKRSIQGNVEQTLGGLHDKGRYAK